MTDTPLVHRLRTLPDFFNAVSVGDKTFEYRRNDRGFKLGDHLSLEEFVPGDGLCSGYTGRTLFRKIRYMLSHEDWSDVPEGFVILGII